MDYASAKFQGGQQNSIAGNQPKEIGILQRVEGMRVGLSDMRLRLESFHNRLSGNGGDPNKEPIPAAGIYGNLGEAESHLRICLALLSELDNKF